MARIQARVLSADETAALKRRSERDKARYLKAQGIRDKSPSEYWWPLWWDR